MGWVFYEGFEWLPGNQSHRWIRRHGDEIVMFPELKLGIIVLTNQQEPDAFTAVSNEIRDGYLGLPKKDWVAEMVLSNKTYKSGKNYGFDTT
jgi:hypothetical protein